VIWLADASLADPAVADLTLPGALEALRRRFEEREGAVQAFLPEPARWERLAGEVAALQQRWPDPSRRPPLFGLPVGVKDIFHVDGFATTAGSAVPPAELAGPQSAAVTRLLGAGALVAGKTVTTEFAYFAPGPTHNPAAPGRTPGGSSSGSAAAVAAGLVPAALGSQTIGSICRPAAFCGVVGFKPTYERVPRDGVVPLAPSLDHVGWLVESVELASRLAAVLCEGWRGTVGAARRAVLGVPEGPYLERASAGALLTFRAVVSRLSAAGFEVRPVPAMADFATLDTRHRLLVAADAWQVHADWFPRWGDRYHAETRALLERGRAADPAEVEAARAGRGVLRAELEAAMAAHEIDLWLSPAAPGPPPLGLAATGDPVMNLPWTYSGLPVLALPAGHDAESLPHGVQLTARAGEDEELLGWGPSVAGALS
jgi:Asp-tRNA(Asn)/Glu-tRNA(Gln) amidotransferase A subunit family amidase